jgi:putative PIN family toxin of toxin-antitoxin system
LPRAVVDVNVLVSALLKPDGGPARLVRAWLAGAFELVASAQLIAELVGVVARPALARRLDQSAVDALVATIQAEAIVVDDPPVARIVPTDPKDDYLVAIAREAGGHVIVTGDRHLLDLERLEPPALTPTAFLDIVERIG